VFDLLASSSLGSLLGMRHAFEPDHLAAVTTLVSRERSGLKAAFLGLCWGIGHTLALVGVGAVLVLLRTEMPARVTALFELSVAVMLIVLGGRTCARAAGLMRHPTVDHPRWWSMHAHSGLPPHLHVGSWTFVRRPLLVGIVHGLAGSGALTALVLATIPSAPARIAYMALFGIGSTVGMAALSGLLGWPLARLGAHRDLGRGLSLIVGLVSMTLGVLWALPLLPGLLRA
jgi:hypothetical protein